MDCISLATRLDNSIKLTKTWKREHELSASSSLETIQLGSACKDVPLSRQGFSRHDVGKELVLV